MSRCVLTIEREYSIVMNGTEFIRRVRRYARRFGLSWRFDPAVGKGSHGRLHVGGRFTMVPRKEIGKGLLAAMLRDLGVDKERF